MGESSVPALPVADLHTTDTSTVLVIDDDYDVRMAVQDTLESEGYRVITAANGKEGLDALALGARPSLILLDLMMPFVHGWAVLDALAGAEIPVVIFSAFEHSAQTITCAAGILAKPVTDVALLDVVRRFCGEPPPRRITLEGLAE